VVRFLHGVTAREASLERAALLKQEHEKVERPGAARLKVGDYARSWIKRKLNRKEVGEDAAKVYAAALEDHVLPALGDYYYDALAEADIQTWIDRSLAGRWRTTDRRGQNRPPATCRRNGRGSCSDGCRCGRTGKLKPYSVVTVQGWFRVFRTMTRDAVSELRLDHDPTLRIRFEQVSGGKNSLKEKQLVDFLVAMRMGYPQHYALVVLLAYTGLRFCHASALRWSDWDEEEKVIAVTRKHTRGRVGPVSRKKLVPKEYPVEPEIAEVLKWHRKRMLRKQLPGFESGYMFPSSAGTLRTPSSLNKAWQVCLGKAEIVERFTPHGMRYTFNNLLRRAKADKIARRALMGHVTEEMQEHYENDVELGEKRDAVAAVIRLAPLHLDEAVGTDVGTEAESAQAVG
jgi:integrase